MKKKISAVFSVVIAIAMVLGAIPAVYAEDSRVECNACYEILSENDVIYDEKGNAMCIYCEEILSQQVLNQLFSEEESEEETDVECPNCGEIIPEEEIEFDEAGVLLCPYCEDTEEEIYESDDPADHAPSDDAYVGIQLNTSEWAKEEAEQAYKKDLVPFEMLGVDLKTDITREQFAAIAVKLYAGITGSNVDTSVEGLPFTDCRQSGSYTPYVAAAYRLGVTNGVDATTFAPQQIITREQLATMLYRVITKAEAEGVAAKEVQVAEAAFADDAAISDYAVESVYYMAQRGIIKGMDETTFAPQGVATKEQAILISNRIAGTLY